MQRAVSTDGAGAQSDDATRVGGVVQVVTDEPMPLSRDGVESLRQRLSFIVNRRPWLIPAVLLGAGMAYLLVRRRR
jgi:hypothetical protein